MGSTQQLTRRLPFSRRDSRHSLSTETHIPTNGRSVPNRWRAGVLPQNKSAPFMWRLVRYKRRKCDGAKQNESVSSVIKKILPIKLQSYIIHFIHCYLLRYNRGIMSLLANLANSNDHSNAMWL